VADMNNWRVLKVTLRQTPATASR